ncbi:MAG: hypothetical protein WBV69_06295 [Candidatus Sulfotelmatobacter sp.]
MLEAVETLPGLRGREDIGSGKCVVRGTQGVCGVRLFGSNGTTAGPLLSAIIAAENHGANNAIAVHGNSPLLIAKATVAGCSFLDDGLQYAAQFGVIGQCRAVGFGLAKGWECQQ